MSSAENRDLITSKIPGSGLSDEVLDEIREAKDVLERRGIADRLTEMVGSPLTASLKMLPKGAEDMVYAAMERSLKIALDISLKTIGDKEAPSGKPSLVTHKLLAGLSGAAGGALGGATVAAELPVSTTLILRSVADIARSEGEDLTDLETRLACLEVFALGPTRPSEINDDTEIGYFAVRAALAKQVHDASKHVLRHGVKNTAAPPLVRLISEIGKRFGVVVSEKIAAQSIPVIGAIGGALINTYFIDHYQDIARAHFAIRRLEREHGKDVVRQAYQSIEF